MSAIGGEDMLAKSKVIAFFIIASLSCAFALNTELASYALDPEKIQAKSMEVQSLVPKWIQSGGNPNDITPLLKKIDEYSKAGDPANVEKTLDQILTIVRTAPPASSDTSLSMAGDPRLLGNTTVKSEAVKLAQIPSTADLVYHKNGQIFTMDREGGHETQITFGKAHSWEHVAVSDDHRHVVANAQPHSTLWIFDLSKGTEARLVSEFAMAGEGGVGIDSRGFIYFSGKPKETGLPDVYKIKADGTNLTQLTNTPDAGELDVSVSQDGSMISYVKMFPQHTEIWVGGSDGKNHRRVYKGGLLGSASAHDPEISPDNKRVAFSVINSKVPRNFAKDPSANTAHDIYSVKLDGTDLICLTKPGPISIIPNWKGTQIAYVEISERDNYAGAAIINDSDPEQIPRRIMRGANSPRWIP